MMHTALLRAKKQMQSMAIGCLRLFRWLLCSMAMLLLVVVGLASLPAVQQGLLCHTLEYLHKKTNYHIQCDNFRFTWLQYVALEGITVTDPDNRLLLEIDRCKGRCSLLGLLLRRSDSVDSVSVAGMRLCIEEDQKQKWNIQAFCTKVLWPFLSETTAAFAIRSIQCSHCDLSYKSPVKKQTYKIANLQGAINNFLSDSNGFSGTITLDYEATNALPFVIKNCTTHFVVAADCMALTNCQLHTMHSSIWGDFTWKHGKQWSLWGASNEPIMLEILLHDTTLSSKELNEFSDYFQGILPFRGILPLSKLKGKCMLIGNRQQAKLTGHIATSIGEVQANCILENLDKEAVTYEGKVALHQMNLALLLPELPITALSAEVCIKGKGMGKKHAHIDAVTHITAMQTAVYTYKDIDASCTFSPTGMVFKVYSKDHNARLAIAGHCCFASLANLHITGTATHLSLDKLGIVSFPLALRMKFSLQFHNIGGKYPEGTIYLHQYLLQSATKQVKGQPIAMQLRQQKKAYLLSVNSPFVDMRLQGCFTLPDLRYHIRYLIAQWKGNQLTLPKKVAIRYGLHCKNITPFLHWFSFDFFLSNATIFRGHFSYNKGYQFSCHLPTVERLHFKQLRIEKAKIALRMRHFMDPKKRFLQLAIASKAQTWCKKFQTDHVVLQLLLEKDRIAFSNELSLLQYGSKLFVAATGTLREASIAFQLLPTSKFTTKDKIWSLHMAQPSIWTKEGISMGKLSIISGSEAIYMEGQLGAIKPQHPLHCMVHNVEINTFLKAAAGNLKGIVDANLIACWESGHLVTTGTLQLKDCAVKEHPIGNVRAKVDWHTAEQHVRLEGTLHHAGQSVWQLSGLYKPFQKKNTLQFATTFHQMDLKWLNPWVAPIFSEITGKLNGSFQLTGTLHAPKLQGKGEVEQGQLKIDCLNTVYKTTGSIQVQNNLLYIDRLCLHDAQSGHAIFTGQIALKSGFPLLLSGKIYDLHLLNTKQAQDADFYGTLYATGDITLTGPVKNVVLAIHATVHRGTFTVIANEKNHISASTQLVRFVYKERHQPNDIWLHRQDQDQAAIKLLLHVKVLPSVEVKLLLNPYGGHDLLQGRGEGKIQLEVGTYQKLHMLGNYRFQNGSCTISVYDFIQKTFAIAPDSQIHFNGYLHESIADVHASYSQLVSIGNHKQFIPVHITFVAYGPLSNPRISYGIAFPDKSIETDLHTKLEEVASRVLLDKSYRNKQILSVLITKRIYDEQKIGGWDALHASINDLLAQQLQNLASTLDRNLGVEADLAIGQWGDSNFFQKTRIKISYLLFAEQFKVSTTFGKHSKLINDWEIAYKIPKAHSMSINLYQKPLLYNLSQSNLFGIAFTYTKRFW